MSKRKRSDFEFTQEIQEVISNDSELSNLKNETIDNQLQENKLLDNLNSIQMLPDFKHTNLGLYRWSPNQDTNVERNINLCSQIQVEKCLGPFYKLDKFDQDFIKRQIDNFILTNFQHYNQKFFKPYQFKKSNQLTQDQGDNKYQNHLFPNSCVNIYGLKQFQELGGNLGDLNFMFSGSILNILSKNKNLENNEHFPVLHKFKNIIQITTHKNQEMNKTYATKGSQMERLLTGNDIEDAKVTNNRDHFEHLNLLQIKIEDKLNFNKEISKTNNQQNLNILITSEVDTLFQNKEKNRIDIAEIKLSDQNGLNEVLLSRGLHWQLISNGCEQVQIGKCSKDQPQPLIEVDKLNLSDILLAAKKYIDEELNNINNNLSQLIKLSKNINDNKPYKVQFEDQQLKIIDIDIKQSKIPNQIQNLF